MTPPVFVVDTNVIVSALIGSDSKAPPAQILGAMLDGRLLYLMSDDLLAEYASVLLRPRLVRLHGRSEAEIDRLLSELTANAIWRETIAGDAAAGDTAAGDTAAGDTAPDAGDDHLWALLASWAGSRLITGDRLLVENASAERPVLTPRDFVNLHKSR